MIFESVERGARQLSSVKDDFIRLAELDDLHTIRFDLRSMISVDRVAQNDGTATLVDVPPLTPGEKQVWIDVAVDILDKVRRRRNGRSTPPTTNKLVVLLADRADVIYVS